MLPFTRSCVTVCGSRFGEEPLHSCEVMLHDIDSSKRLNTAMAAAMRADKNDSTKDDVCDIISLFCC